MTHAAQTKGLALEEIAAKFGDEVAVELSHLSAEERARLDKTLVHEVMQMEHALLA
jgi:hypothetical protein